MKFSVLISLYNGEIESNLADCLISLDNQTLRADQIVIVYDGPIRDSLNSIVISYQKKLNIDVVRLEKNVGLGCALSKGLDMCEHELIARMDTDDICRMNRFEKQMSEFYKDFSLDLLGASIQEFCDDFTREKKLPLSKNEIIEFSKLKNPMNHMTVMFKKSSVVKAGGYIHHYFMEDYNLWLRMINKNMNIKNVDDILVDARVGKEMVSRRRGKKYIKSELELFNLKNNLGITKGIEGVSILIIRVLVRIIPASMLNILYKRDRS